MALDSHQHFWQYDPLQYPWMQSGWPIRRDFLPPDLQQEQEKVGLHGSVAVQARQSLEESRWLLELADHHEIIRGVVGWVDLQSEEVARQLAQFASHKKFVGVRHVVQDEPDDQFMLRPEFQRGIAQLQRFELTYDILIFPKQLPAAIELARRFPSQPFVLDHIAKPHIKRGVRSPWDTQIRELAQSPNVLCKVSGMVTEADWTGWRAEDFRPYLDVVFEAFGPDRVMFGSDWPVALLAGTYEQVVKLARDYTGQFSAQDQEKFYQTNAVRFYGLE